MATRTPCFAQHGGICQVHTSQVLQHAQFQDVSPTAQLLCVSEDALNWPGIWVELECHNIARADDPSVLFCFRFIHVRSFSNSGGSSTTALWVNKGLAETAQQQGADPEDIATVLLLKRAEACDTARTVEGRRVRKKLAISVVEEDFGVATKSLQQVQATRRSSKSEQIPKAVAAPLNTYHYQTKHGLVLEHYNHNTATFSKIIPSPTAPKEIRLSNYTDHLHINDIHQHCGSPMRTVSTSNGEEHHPLDVPKLSLRPPTSSASAANLLLLLSKTQ